MPAITITGKKVTIQSISCCTAVRILNLIFVVCVLATSITDDLPLWITALFPSDGHAPEWVRWGAHFRCWKERKQWKKKRPTRSRQKPTTTAAANKQQQQQPADGEKRWEMPEKNGKRPTGRSNQTRRLLRAKKEEASVFNCFHDAIRPFSFPFLLTYTLFHLCRHSRHHGPNEHRRRCRRLSFFSVKYFAHSSRSLLFFYCLDVHILLGRWKIPNNTRLECMHSAFHRTTITATTKIGRSIQFLSSFNEYSVMAVHSPLVPASRIFGPLLAECADPPDPSEIIQCSRREIVEQSTTKSLHRRLTNSNGKGICSPTSALNFVRAETRSTSAYRRQ